MMKNYDQSTEINHILNCNCIPGHFHRILIIGRSGSGKTNVLLNLIKHTSKIHSNESMNLLSMEEKKQESKH